MVQVRASAINLPMLEVPGLSESHRLPNAVAVVMALKTTARVRLFLDFVTEWFRKQVPAQQPPYAGSLSRGR